VVTIKYYFHDRKSQFKEKATAEINKVYCIQKKGQASGELTSGVRSSTTDFIAVILILIYLPLNPGIMQSILRRWLLSTTLCHE
jgi:hypothetical protein